MPPPPPRLPRSLAPLPGEELPGYTLRLAHRLDLTPIELLRQTGLVATDRHAAPARLMLTMEGDALTRFCAATTMSAKDALGLTFRPYVTSYPPVAEATLGLGGYGIRARGVFPAWLLTTSTRYCPECLAGDGSPIQQRHGGPWQSQWRMATNFACLEHHSFLRTTCPACALPAQMIRGNSRRLIPEPHVGGLHPAQCRNVPHPRAGACAARLDTPIGTSEDLPTPELLDLQDRLHRAQPYGAGQSPDPMAGHNRMSDLLIMATLTRATWPLTAHHTSNNALARALDQDLERPGPAPSLRLSAKTAVRWDSEPFSAPGTAALLEISAKILNLPVLEFRTELGHIVARLPEREETAWGHTWLALKRDSSPLFKHELHQALNQRFPRPFPTQAATPSPLLASKRRCRPEAIPQWLPDDWLDVATESFSRRKGNAALRRGLAAHLVQTATGMSLKEAATYLGIPPGWMADWSRFRPLEERIHGQDADLGKILDRLADHVRSQPAIDYYARRQRFAHWTLPEPEMRKLAADFPGHRRRRLAGSQSGLRLHACLSAKAWSQLTGSEWRLSPSLLPPITPPTGPSAIDATVISMLRSSRLQCDYYSYLRAAMANHCSRILTDHENPA
ncbi:TniQ family protein [Streptomyces sp. NPDC058368]|uniref:TniQ family protein n=1 Tax=Streptomyces sp. NPDC058368 TaxID=3346461 RepID=UPI003648514C